MNRDAIEKLIGSIEGLPTLPSVVARVNELVDEPTASAGDINEVISQDMALSSKILRMVNSAFYGFPRRISSMTHAVVILGFQTVRNLALSAFVLDAFDSKSMALDHRAFWVHSVAVGVAANAVGARHGVPLGEDALMCGLLHDVGKLVLSQYAGREYYETVVKARAAGITLIEAENEILGVTHADVGGMLMEHWNLPEKMVAVLGQHHSPAECSPDTIKLVSAVHVADVLVRALLIGSGGDESIPAVAEEAWRALALSEAELPDLLREISAEVLRVRDFIELVQGSRSAT